MGGLAIIFWGGLYIFANMLLRKFKILEGPGATWLHPCNTYLGKFVVEKYSNFELKKKIEEKKDRRGQLLLFFWVIS